MRRRYKLLGALAVEEDGRASPLMKSDKGCALMAALIVHGRPLRREYLADLIWDSATTAQSLTRLRVLLSRVRKWMPELQADRKQLSFHVTENSSVDFLELHRALLAEDEALLDEGVRLYAGDLLAGYYLKDAPRFNEWLLLEQEKLRLQVVTAYRQLCVRYVEQKAWLKGVSAARRWLQLDEFDEEALRYLLQFLAASGQVDVALKQYEHNRGLLWAELAVEPEQETAELARRLADLRAKTGGGLAWDDILGAQVTRPAQGQLAEPGSLPPNAYLPYQRNNDFTGRRESLRYLAEKLLPWPEGNIKLQRTAAVTGMGGMGKTQLAVEFAYRYGRFFPGGVFWISFAQADDVAGEVALIGGERGMGLYKQADQLTLADQVGRVQKGWQEAVPRLLIFDNCEEEALLAEWLPKTGGCRVLLTSRRGHWARDLNVAQWPLPVLDSTESAAFLRRLLPDLDLAEAAAIAKEVGYLPLALHLAGGFLRRYPQIEAAQYLAQLKDKGLLAHPSLQGRGASHSPTGHELNVGRTFGLSMAQFHLDDEVDMMARRMLACTACFAPGEPVAQDLVRTCVVNDDDELMTMLLAEDGLARLVTLGFLEAEGRETVVLHRLLAAYSLEEMAGGSLINDAQTAVEANLVRVLFDSREKEGNLAYLPISVVHLSHVTENAISKRAPLAPHLATLLGRHLRNIGSNDEAERVLIIAEALAEDFGDVDIRIQALNALARTQESLGYDEASLQNAQKGVELLKQSEHSDPAELGMALYRMGWALFRLGQADEALAAAAEGYEISVAADQARMMATNLNLMGVVNYYILGNYTVAERYLTQSLAIFTDLGYRSNQASTLNNMGESARLQGDYERAEAYYAEALAIARELENRNLENIVLSNLCGTRLRLDDYKTAASDLEKLIGRTRIDWFGASEAFRFLAEAYLGLGKIGRALEKAQGALALAHAANVAENGRAWRVLGFVAAESGRAVQARAEENVFYEAADCYRKSIAFFEELDLERDYAISLWRWAQFELANGDGEQGKRLWLEAHVLFEQLGLPLFIDRMGQGP